MYSLFLSGFWLCCSCRSSCCCLLLLCSCSCSCCWFLQNNAELLSWSKAAPLVSVSCARVLFVSVLSLYCATRAHNLLACDAVEAVKLSHWRRLHRLVCTPSLDELTKTQDRDKDTDYRSLLRRKGIHTERTSAEDWPLVPSYICILYRAPTHSVVIINLTLLNPEVLSTEELDHYKKENISSHKISTTDSTSYSYVECG